MSTFKAFEAGTSESQTRQFLAYLFAQASRGFATNGVMGDGLLVRQTATASGSVEVTSGMAVQQSSVTGGARPLIANATETLDVLTATPMGALPRNDLIVFDSTTDSLVVVVGTPNASPTDPTPVNPSVVLGRLRHAANATTVPTSAIDDLRTFTTLNMPAPPEWVPFSPVWSNAGGTTLQINSGSVQGWTLDDGHVRHVHIELLRGSDSNVGTVDYWFSYPTTGVDTARQISGSAWYFRTSGGANYGGTVKNIAAGQVAVITDGGFALLGGPTFTGGTPWGSGGRITLDFTVPLL